MFPAVFFILVFSQVRFAVCQNHTGIIPNDSYSSYDDQSDFTLIYILCFFVLVGLLLIVWQRNNQDSGNAESSTALTTLSESSTARSSAHSHLLASSTRNNGWVCDGCGASDTHGVGRFRCTAGCDFDLCDKCMTSTQVDPIPQNTENQTPDPIYSPLSGIGQASGGATRQRAISFFKNQPGKWDIFISYSREHPDAVVLAKKLYDTLTGLKFDIWLDIKMPNHSAAAIEEGIQCLFHVCPCYPDRHIHTALPTDDRGGHT
jgi:hypothetical protein